MASIDSATVLITRPTSGPGELSRRGEAIAASPQSPLTDQDAR